MGGFTASQDQSVADSTYQVFTFAVDAAHATLLAPGDVMKITGESDSEGFGEIDAAAATGAITGVVVGFEPQYVGEQLTETGLPATTAGIARVQVGRDILYDVDVANGPLLAADVGLNVNSVVTAATKTGGLTVSNMTVNATGKAVTQTLQWRVVRLIEDAAGVIGGRATVRMNNTTTSDGAAGV